MDTKDILLQLNEAKAIINNCIDALSKKGGKQKSKVPSVKTKSDLSAVRPSKLDFGLNERNFIRTYARGLSGPKKFTLLLARITKGKTGADTGLGIVRSKWNKMTVKNLMGYEFNLKYPNEAKTRGWIDSKKSGIYHLLNGWMDIFK